MKVNEGNLQENLFFSRGYIYIYISFLLLVCFIFWRKAHVRYRAYCTSWKFSELIAATGCAGDEGLHFRRCQIKTEASCEDRSQS